MSEYSSILKSVFLSEQDPNSLAKLLHSMVRPVEMSVDAISGIVVDNGTELASIKTILGTKHSIVVDGVPADVTVAWDSDTNPTYVAATAGDYVLGGTISGLPSNVKNSAGKKMKVTITVKEAEE